MSRMESLASVVAIPNANHSRTDRAQALETRNRLLDVNDVAEWLGVSEGWVRDHASGRRQPGLVAIKLGPPKGKGLWKFREEDVYDFIREQRLRSVGVISRQRHSTV